MKKRNIPIPKQYLGAFKAGHRQNTREFIDEELSYELLHKIVESNYTDTKSMETLAYITKFNDEFHKNVVKKNDTKAIHNTDKLRKDCYSRENAKNRDIMSRENKFLMNLLDNTNPPADSDNITIADGYNYSSINSHENTVIDLIDSQRTIKMLTEEDIKSPNILVSANVLTNIKQLVEHVNKIQLIWEKQFKVTSGYRTMEQHLAIYKKKGITNPKLIPMKSKHLSGLAVDIADPKGSLYGFLTSPTGLKLLDSYQLWMEADTVGWVHLQIVPPSSGKRVFKP